MELLHGAASHSQGKVLSRMGSEAGDRKRRGSHSADMSVKINTECSCGWICVVAATVFYVLFGLAAAQQPNAGDRGNADQGKIIPFIVHLFRD